VNEKLTRIGRDLKQGREVESYIAAFVSVAFAVMSFFGDLVSADLRWAVCMMGIGILVYRSARAEEQEGTAPAPPAPVNGVWMLVELGERPDGAVIVSVSVRPAP
jgi:hypothetical protein